MDKPNHPIGKKGTSYPKEFREESVRYWLSSGKKATEVARELGVSDWSLHRWHKEMEQVSVPIPTENGQLNALELAKDRVPMEWVAALTTRVGVHDPAARDFKKAIAQRTA